MAAAGAPPPAQPAAPRVKGLNCPSCGAALSVRTFEHALTVVCPNCLSILDAKDPNYQVLQKFEARQKYKPFIPLGTRGRLHDATCEVIGFQVRSIQVEGVTYSWREYLLFNPYQGFRYLTEYDGHWNEVRTVRAIPEPLTSIGKAKVKLGEETFTHFQTSTAKTTFVLGEFPWQVRVGETAEVKDYIAPPRMLSAETTEQETTWSLGDYRTGQQVWEMFRLPGSPPGPTGVFADQPSPYQGRPKRVWKQFTLFLLGVIALALLFAMFSRQEEMLRQTYSHIQQPGEASFVTNIFELRGRPSDVEVSLRTNLSNNWAYFNFALINDSTGQAFDFGREVSYYFGRDSDGAWSEGSTTDRALIPSVPPGRYYLRVEPEMEQGRTMAYELRVRRDVPDNRFFWIAAALLVVPPIFMTVRALTFEQKRWQESDYGSAFSSSGDNE